MATTTVFLPLQNSTDRGAWQATVYNVTKSPTQLNTRTFASFKVHTNHRGDLAQLQILTQ